MADMFSSSEIERQVEKNLFERYRVSIRTDRSSYLIIKPYTSGVRKAELCLSTPDLLCSSIDTRDQEIASRLS